ncbi:hypothetical protein [Leptospira meyeri]|uniref:hypothetical protein n=1 Tax=Leptospira meyeri TaxID=29508 RepID=UPI0010842523|nr:hypothetical protein [Leptospira meyeri]
MPILCKHKVSVRGNYYSKNQNVEKCYVSAFSYTIKNKPTTKEEREKLLKLGWYEAHDLKNKITVEYSLQTTFTKPKFYIDGKPPEFNFEHDVPITEPWLTAVEFNIESIKELTYIGYSK